MTTALTVLIWVAALSLGLPLVFWLVFTVIAAIAVALDERDQRKRKKRQPVRTRR